MDLYSLFGKLNHGTYRWLTVILDSNIRDEQRQFVNAGDVGSWVIYYKFTVPLQ